MKQLFSIVLMCALLMSACEDNSTPGPSNNNNGIGSNTNCPSTVTDIDGNVYNVVGIGNQCWMKENLKTTKYRNGDDLTTGLTGLQWHNSTSGAWTFYNDNPQYNNPYGKLYNGYAVADSRGLCPTGWHVPTDSEWNILVKYLDPNADTAAYFQQSQIAGGMMKTSGDLQSVTGLWEYPNTGATNSSGFSGLPSGQRNAGNYYYIGNQGFWWSYSGFFNSPTEVVRSLNYGDGNVGRGNSDKRLGLSVRCLRD